MRKLVYCAASTLDGFVAGPDGGTPTGPDGFWTPYDEDTLAHFVAEYPETLPGPAREALGVTAPGTRFDTVLEGRASYETGLAAGVDDAYPHLRHLVFSTTLESVPGAAVELVRGDAVERVRALKREAGKDIWLVGGGRLAGSLYEEIDRIILKLAPLTAGTGVPLFGVGAAFAPRHWELTGHTVLKAGFAHLTYDRKEKEA
ncbi:dihydrofolate reductase family protein [Streptomyces albidoflavus]